MFGINCTRINQSQPRNISLYIISHVTTCNSGILSQFLGQTQLEIANSRYMRLGDNSLFAAKIDKIDTKVEQYNNCFYVDCGVRDYIKVSAETDTFRLITTSNNCNICCDLIRCDFLLLMDVNEWMSYECLMKA